MPETPIKTVVRPTWETDYGKKKGRTFIETPPRKTRLNRSASNVPFSEQASQRAAQQAKKCLTQKSPKMGEGEEKKDPAQLV